MVARDCKVGVDIIDIARIARALARPGFATRCFTPFERRFCLARKRPEQHFAARFAAKEAIAKAVGRRLAWREIEMGRSPLGAPLVRLRGRARQLLRGASVNVSISHCDCHAAAVALVLREREP
jgi:holo-[acyl-carrier protein] synthase